MFSDLFGKLHLAAIILVLVAMALLLGGFIDAGDTPLRQKPDPALERAMQEKARASFLLEAFQPIEELAAAGRYAEALLKLQELEKEYPGAPHALILQGSILVAQGVMNEGISRYAAAVKLNGDYVDEKSSLHRRAEISALVESGIPAVKATLRENGNTSLEKSLKELYYLQSRLAGGCE